MQNHSYEGNRNDTRAYPSNVPASTRQSQGYPASRPGPAGPQYAQLPQSQQVPDAPQMLPTYPPQYTPAPAPPVPPVSAQAQQDASVQIRQAALLAAKSYLNDRSYDDNATRLAAEMSLAKFFLGES